VRKIGGSNSAADIAKTEFARQVTRDATALPVNRIVPIVPIAITSRRVDNGRAMNYAVSCVASVTARGAG
jgi:hypothetical protein